MLVQIRKRCSFEYVKIKPAILCSPLEIGPYLWLELKWIDVDTGRNYWLMPRQSHGENWLHSHLLRPKMTYN